MKRMHRVIIGALLVVVPVGAIVVLVAAGVR
jgi:hypothetical protein